MGDDQRGLSRFADVILAALIVLMVGMMIVPLPTVVLDVLIASNISLAVVMLLVSIQIKGGLQFTAFPTILLVTTLYRLALNVSSTRLILLQADAGDVIHSFGHFVVSGNYVVGAVIFLILTLIQFVVIAKGSERVAEVGARFTLDAMPGKQMSIDAEQRSGAISQDEARARRRNLQRESEFFGSMDGAMKFVKGDAIAGVVITVINIVGGLAIGVAMRDMEATTALKTYGLLTIGDGLVSQIPALLISTAAGLVVTRVSSEDEGGSLGRDIARQVFGNPSALSIGGVFLLALAAVPGLPVLPFLVLGAALLVGAQRARRALVSAKRDDEDRAGHARDADRRPTPLLVPIAVELGPELAVRLLDSGTLVEEELPKLESELFGELGLSLPGIHTRTSNHLLSNQYLILASEIPAGSGELVRGRLLARCEPERALDLGIKGQATHLPWSTEPALWVSAEDSKTLLAQGIPCFSESELIAHHVGLAVRRQTADFIGIQEAQGMLDRLERVYPALVQNVVPKPISVALLADILRRLAGEGVSIRPLREILEALATYASTERDPVALTELVRATLKRHITHKHAMDGVLPVLLLSPEIEDAVRESIQRTATGSYLAMPPDMAKEVIDATRKASGPPRPEVIILTQGDVRRYVRRLLEVDLPEAVVLSYQELAPEITVQPIGNVSL